MVDSSTTTSVQVTPDGGPPPTGRARRSLLFAGLGVLLAGILVAVLLTQTGGSNRTTTGPDGVGLAGVTEPTAALLSLSVLPGGGRPAPDFQLSDQAGKPVSLSQYRGRSVVLSFNDDRCTDVCTLLAEDVIRADQNMSTAARSHVVFLSVNVNPYFAQVPDVRKWSNDNELGNVTNWVFGTGPVPTLQSVWKAYGVYVGLDPTTRSVTHSTLIEFIDPSGRIRATADFGQNAVDVDPYSHGLAQAAVDFLPAAERSPVAGPQAPAPGGSGTGLGQQAPGFSLPVLDAGSSGTPGALDLRSLRGRPVVVNFWASTCQDCRTELSAFAAVAASDPKIAFVGVDVGDPSTSAALSLARAAGVHYPLVSDAGGQVAATYRVTGLPTSVYIDPTGVVSVVHPGALTAEQLRYTLGQFFPNFVPAES